jgi:hypothetical protein
MPGKDSTPREQALKLLQQALKPGIRGKARDALRYALDVLEDDGRAQITDLHCRNLRYGDKPLRVPNCPGLGLHANKNSKAWRQRIMVDGSEKMITIGVYPEVSLLQAMAAWERNRDEGPVPGATNDAPPAITVKKLAERVIAEHVRHM